MRDDFKNSVKDNLAKRVGYRCSNPTCRQLTSGPQEESSSVINIGVAAHITAASLGGPRFDSSFTPEQRKAPENGIWLCQNCAKLVDSDPTKYTPEILKKWKQIAEDKAIKELEGRSTFHQGIEQIPFQKLKDTIALSINLKRELLENLKLLISKNKKGAIYRNTDYCYVARKCYKGNIKDKSSIPGKQLRSLGLYCRLYTNFCFRMKYQFIDIAIESGRFLKFTTSSNNLKSGVINNALVDLKENIIKVKDMENCFSKDRGNLAKKFLKMHDNNECFLVDNLELVTVFKIFDYQENIIELSKSVIKALNGDEKYLNNIRLNPDGLLGSDKKKYQNEITTTEYIEKMIDYI